MFAKICQDSRLMGDGKKRIDGDKLLSFRSKHGQAQGIRPMFRTLKSNSPFSAPRDDTARASCGNGAKRKLLSFAVDVSLCRRGLGAGRGNRTLLASLEGWSFTTKLYPRALQQKNTPILPTVCLQLQVGIFA